MAGTFGVHQSRYQLAFGAGAAESLERHGHGYLVVVGPVVAAVMAAALAQLLQRVARGAVDDRPAEVRTRRLWPLAAAGLLAMYAGQELLEGALSAGHPDGLTGVFGSGGWLAVPLSTIGGLAVAIAMRVARAVDRRGCTRIAVTRVFATPLARHPTDPPARRIGRLLAARLAGRAPPRPSVVR